MCRALFGLPRAEGRVQKENAASEGVTKREAACMATCDCAHETKI